MIKITTRLKVIIAFISLSVAIYFTVSITFEGSSTRKYSCEASGAKSNCNQSDNQTVIINNQ